MHTSPMCAASTLRELRRCAPHGSLPPCGGGTAGGVASQPPDRRSPRTKTRDRQLANTSLGPTCTTKEVRVVPPSLSLPRKGGGNAVAPLCPTADQHSHRSFAQGFV